MSPPSSAASEPRGTSLWSAFLPLLPFMAATFVAFLATGMALPVVPRHVHETLGQGTAMVGSVMGIQYLAAVFGRIWSGGMTDERGPRVAALGGMVAAAGAGGAYLASAALTGAPQLALGLVFAGRVLTGLTESFVITSIMAWAFARVGAAHAGKALGWIGVALFAGFAAGAPLGTALHARFGFGGLALAVLLTGVVGFIGTSRIGAVAPSTLPRPPFRAVMGLVKLPGFGLTLCSMGYAMIAAFAVLLFAQRGWGGGALAVTAMSVGFIAARLLLGHLPDQAGGARVALWCVLAGAFGLALIWAGPHPVLAWLGAALAGVGYAMGFQGFGVEAVRRVPPQSRGAAMGAFVIYQDVSMGLGPPLAGVLAQAVGLDAVFIIAAAGALGAAAVAAALLRQDR